MSQQASEAPTGGPSGGPPSAPTGVPRIPRGRRERKPPPPLKLFELNSHTSKVTVEMIEKFLVEKEKPREPKRKRFMYSGSSSTTTVSSENTSTFPGGENQLEKISKLMGDLVNEMKDENCVEMPKNIYSLLFSELYQIKKHCPLHQNSIEKLEIEIEKHLDSFFKKRSENISKSENKKESLSVTFKMYTNLLKWFEKMLKKYDVNCEETFQRSFGNEFFSKIDISIFQDDETIEFIKKYL
eukprot:gene9034-1132_t